MTERIRLGRSDLVVSPVCYGSWQLSPKFWGDQPKDTLIRAMRKAFDVGVNFYDTADAYGDGLSESVMGEALQEIPRDEIVVATKVYHHFYPDGHRHPDLSCRYIIAECEASLKRLRMDTIDLYQCHAFEPYTRIEETVEAMERLLADGKIRAYGVSNFTTEQFRMARNFGEFSTVQPRYSLIDRQAEDDLLPYCYANDIGVLVYSPLHHGLLTGKYEGSEPFADFRGNLPTFQGERFREIATKVRQLRPLAEKYGLSIIQLVLAATLSHPAVHCVIVGVKKPEHIEEAAGAMDKQIELEDYYAIRAILG